MCRRINQQGLLGSTPKLIHELISTTLSGNIVDFYRLFLVPGLNQNHCAGGPGAWALGQETFMGQESNKINDSEHNILLALVDWVEGGIAPSSITGIADDLDGRIHYMYSQKSVAVRHRVEVYVANNDLPTMLSQLSVN
jgi:feruloyl esterase